MRPVLILGGYGNFGKRIARALSKSSIPIIIAGRNEQKAKSFKQELGDNASFACFDAFKELHETLDKLLPCVVINTCGPFQNNDYSIAQTCVKHGVNYIDLADGRDFVTGIFRLDQAAKDSDVAVISGASTVPGLSSAVIEKYKNEFSQIDEMIFGISPGQKADRGLATTQGIMSYVGKRLRPFPSVHGKVYGWQDIYRQKFPVIGKRWMANCDIPDLDLFPKHYAISKIQFSAGVELGFMHLALWLMSWMIRLKLPLDLPSLAKPLLKISHWFDRFGTADGGMHIILKGKSPLGKPHTRKWFIIALDGDGPQIPTIPAIILAKKIATGELSFKGAEACVGMVSLDEYLEELQDFNITTYEE